MALIEISNASLEYPIVGQFSHSIRNHVIQAVGGRLLGRKGRWPVSWLRSLDNINLVINPGDRLGVIGHNGAGKTSLLRLISGVYQPCEGTIKRNGKIQALTDFTLGMDANASGLQNIFFRLAFMGLSKKRASELVPEIIEFSELGEFINYPLHSYSTGMYLRLAFAISTQVNPDILIMDEVIGAGDERFRQKAESRINNLISEANAMILCSHSLVSITKHCSRVIVLKSGKIVFDGATNDAINVYKNLN